jgi:hypothetical protein
LWKQRCNTDLMAPALMMNREPFYQHLCPG